MHEELNYNGGKRLKNVPSCDQKIEQESFNFFMRVNVDLNLSIFSFLFYGIVKSCTICLSCKNELYNFQYFQFLSFPLYDYQGKIFNIYSGFKDYTKEEYMSGDNKCYCQSCKDLKEAKVSSKIFYTPPYLIINFDYGKGKKYIPNEITFGDSIDLTGFTTENCSERTYKLVAVSTHIGRSGNTGHYIAFCKDDKNNWHKFNDSLHEECSFEQIYGYSPYLLIYKKQK